MQTLPVFIRYCVYYRATNQEFAKVAKAFNSLKETVDRDVLFVRVAIDNCPRIFQYHDFQTAPIITYLPKDEVMGKKVIFLNTPDI